MLSGKELILATRPYAKENRLRSWFYTISTFLILCGSFASTLLDVHISLRIPASIFSGLMMVRMFVLYHDHQHHAILHRSVAGNIIMTAYGWFNLAPPGIWKRSHDYHHKHNSKLYSASIGSYPIATKSKFLSMSPKERSAYLSTRHPLTILSGYLSMFVIGMCLNSFLSSPRRHLDSLFALVVHFAGSVLIFYFFGWISYVLFILVPFSIACGIGAYLFYAQHNFPGVRFADKKGWAYETAALESSSFMKMNPFLNWITANIGYHHIHHMNSRIPFYRLPEVMEKFPEFQAARTTSLGLKDIMACFKLKVWDPENNRMIGLQEIREREAVRM